MGSCEASSKTVTVTLTAKFYGDYLDVEEVEEHLEFWVDSALEDRDDLIDWNFTDWNVVEEFNASNDYL